MLKNVIGKLGALVDSGLLNSDGSASIRVYKDNNGNIVGYTVDGSGLSSLSEKLNTPIEQGWRDTKKALDEMKQNGAFD